MQVAAVGFWAAVCLGEAGAVGTLISKQVGVDRVVTGYPATSTLACVSGLTASG